MNAIEIRGLTKSFRGMYALNGLNMNVPVGGGLLALGLGALSNVVLKRTSLA